MMASNNLALDTIDDTTNANIDLTPRKKHKRGKRTPLSENTNGVIEHADELTSEPIPSTSSKRSKSKKVNESTLETSLDTKLSEENSQWHSYQLDQPLPSLRSSQPDKKMTEKNPNYKEIELTNVTDDEENEEEKQQQIKRNMPLTNRITIDRDTMVSSFTTTADNDVIEIHEFSLADVDAYLDIYFETLNNRLSHFIGQKDQLDQFRTVMKNRITTDLNAREYQNVLLGKMNGDVAAAVTLSFPGETSTINNNDLLPQSSSCFTSIRRWMIRNANYIPTNMEECYIEMIGVKTPYQKRGIGAAMLECVEHFARQAGALLLTVHTNTVQLRNYFQRFGFDIDHTDNSAFWKWTVERENIDKMSKDILPEEENTDYPTDNTGSYINESMAGSEIE